MFNLKGKFTSTSYQLSRSAIGMKELLFLTQKGQTILVIDFDQTYVLELYFKVIFKSTIGWDNTCSTWGALIMNSYACL